ncbi:MAG: Hydantoinase/oxoprolinase [Firmicutes bacterium]|nr:Hydantoinase/oxoprolinase [Bacillota bacterium]
MRIGIDVGGTNTDSVLMDGAKVLASHKTPTTPDVTSGITASVTQLMRETGVKPADVQAVMIGTTHFANAVVERQRLSPVAAVRLGLPATDALPPLCDWPDEVVAAMGGEVFLVRGGYEFDGREISPLDEVEIRRIGRRIHDAGIRAAAVSSVFSPVNDSMEQRAAAILLEECPDLLVTRSADIGRVGLLERENAAILNAALRSLAAHLVEGFRQALRDLGLNAPFFFTQNDGTLMAAEFAEQFPVLTFSSGPTNSMRGAAFLSGIRDGIVVDIGGTTTDVGVLVGGFPRPAAAAVSVGGVRTNFRMPDVLSIGLGGGSIVRTEPLQIGPRSVGYRLTEQARIFGGDTLTTTDVVVAAGRLQLGDASRVGDLDAAFVTAALQEMQAMVAAAIDAVKTSAAPVPVIVVGGGSILVGDAVPGASHVIKPPHFQVANAIGAAIAQVGGEVDRIYSTEGATREAVLDRARLEAVDKAVAAGADPESVEIVDLEEVPLAYLPGNAVRIRVKAVGELKAQLIGNGGRN